MNIIVTIIDEGVLILDGWSVIVQLGEEGHVLITMQTFCT